jgi:hypothetical protein
MSWTASPFPPLPDQQVETVRQVVHDTGLDGYAAWLAVADVMAHGEASPYAAFVWPHVEAAQGWQRGHMQVTVTYSPQAYERGRRIPERRRRAHQAYARAHGFFWLPCPLCGQMFGGHEWRHIDGKPAAIYTDPGDPGHGTGICPSCTRTGGGRWDGIRVENVTCFCRECAVYRRELEEPPPKPQRWRIPLAVWFLITVPALAFDAYHAVGYGNTGMGALWAFCAAAELHLTFFNGREYHRRSKARRQRKR